MRLTGQKDLFFYTWNHFSKFLLLQDELSKTVYVKCSRLTNWKKRQFFPPNPPLIELQFQLLKEEHNFIPKVRKGKKHPTYVCLMDDTWILPQHLPWQVPHHQLFTNWFFCLWSATGTMFILIILSVFNVFVSNLRSSFTSERSQFTSAIFPIKKNIHLFFFHWEIWKKF